MQMMDIAHHPLGKGVIFSARMILGLCVASAGIWLGVVVATWIHVGDYEFAVPVIVGSVIGGLAAGFILKKHFFWVLPIPIVWVLAGAYLSPEPNHWQEISNVGYAFFALMGTAFPAYVGAFFGFSISKGVNSWRAAHSDPRVTKFPTGYMQMIDTATKSLPKSLALAARIVLGIAVAAGGIVVAYWLSVNEVLEVGSAGFFALFFASEFLGGVVSGYILRRHYLWVLPISAFIVGTLIILFPELFLGSGEGPEFAFILLAFGLPIYPGAALGYLISRRVSARRTRTQ